MITLNTIIVKSLNFAQIIKKNEAFFYFLFKHNQNIESKLQEKQNSQNFNN